MWQTVFDVILDALLDSLIILPFLIAVHVFIEYYEYKVNSGQRRNRLLSGRAAPLLGAGLGLIPQCGFSVASTKLYTSGKIRLGTLLAVYIATSDEAVPVLLSNPSAAIKLLPLLLIKFIMALLAGYAVNLIISKSRRAKLTKSLAAGQTLPQDAPDSDIFGIIPRSSAAESGGKAAAESGACSGVDTSHLKTTDSGLEQNTAAVNADTEQSLCGCCGKEHSHGDKTLKDGKAAFDWDRFIFHPLIHSLTVFAFIFAVNLLMGGLMAYFGEESIEYALDKASYAQVPLAALVGLIPNCAASVIITQLYALGSLSLGACVAGLSVNAGIAFVVLFKENKNLKQNLLILTGIILYSIACGFIIAVVF